MGPNLIKRFIYDEKHDEKCHTNKWPTCHRKVGHLDKVEGKIYTSTQLISPLSGSISLWNGQAKKLLNRAAIEQHRAILINKIFGKQ